MKRVLPFLLLALCSAMAQGAAAPGGRLSIEIPEIKSQQGTITIAVFSSSEGFPSRPEAADFTARISDYAGSLSHTFENVPFGEYAVAITQDRNDNGRIDRRRLPPIPKEPVGMSNISTMGRPAFDRSKQLFSEDGAVFVVEFLNQ